MKSQHCGIAAAYLQKAAHAYRRCLRFRSSPEISLPDNATDLLVSRHSRVQLTLIENKHYREPGSHETATNASRCMTVTDYIWLVGTLI